MSLEETVRLSTAMGAANVMCSGTQAAEYEVISELISKVAMHTMQNTIFIRYHRKENYL